MFTVPADLRSDFQVRDHNHRSIRGDTVQDDEVSNKLHATMAIHGKLQAHSWSMLAESGNVGEKED